MSAANGATHDVPAAAVLAIAERLALGREPLARQIVERFRADTADPEDEQLEAEQLAFTLENIDAFVETLRGAEPITGRWAAVIRENAARRVHLRVSLEWFLHAARIWGEELWEAVVASAGSERPGEREAAIRIASILMRQVDVLSRVAMNAYLDETTDRGLLRRDLLDALISGQGEGPAVQCQARALHLTLAESYVVVVVRDAEMHGEVGQDEPLSSRVALDRIVATTRSRVQPPASVGSALAGVRNGDLVVLYPVTGPGELAAVREHCLELARTLTADLHIGMSGYHGGRRAIGAAYAEARDAAALASRLGIRGRALSIEDLLIDHMLLASAHARRILEATLRPLSDYDREHGSELLVTLGAYVRAHFNLTRSAEFLTVHPNTVVYRLRRIRELSGRDPHDVDDLMLLTLGLKARELYAVGETYEGAHRIS
jgi:sugar diacid utilization regulator